MKNRRSFLASVVTGSAGLALLGVDGGSSPPPSGAPSASPAHVHVASAAALAAAAAMRAFDPKLTDDEIAVIAKGIDDNRTGSALNPKKKRLQNGDEPVTRFAAAEPLA